MVTVFLVDDHEVVRKGVRSYLETLPDFRVVGEAASGEEGIEMVSELIPDIVLLDLMLPGLSGTEVCREIRKTSKVPVIMVTAKDSEIDKVVGLELGADDYVTKPLAPES